MVGPGGHGRSADDGRALIGSEAEAQEVRRRDLAGWRHHLGNTADPGPENLDEDGVLDAFELRRSSREVCGVGHLEEEHRRKLTGFGHDAIERVELTRDPVRVVNALGAQRLLNRGSNRLAVFEDQGEGVPEVNPPESLQLGDAMALLAAGELIAGADTDVVGAELGGSFRGHEHLHQRETERGDSGISQPVQDAL